jgi:RNA polymerase sigma-70 factor (ECF subfamily)
VQSALAGRLEGYAELARRWSAAVLAICHARVRRHDIAEELAQETLLRGLRGLRTLDAPDKFGPWLRGIANRVCLDWLKSKQTSQVPFTQLAASGHPDAVLASPDTSAQVDNADELQSLMREVERLSDEHREVLMLYYYNDVTYRELAERLGVSVATINARLTQARALLRTRLCPTATDNASAGSFKTQSSPGVAGAGPTGSPGLQMPGLHKASSPGHPI